MRPLKITLKQLQNTDRIQNKRFLHFFTRARAFELKAAKKEELRLKRLKERKEAEVARKKKLAEEYAAHEALVKENARIAKIHDARAYEGLLDLNSRLIISGIVRADLRTLPYPSPSRIPRFNQWRARHLGYFNYSSWRETGCLRSEAGN